jgi:hypothetical protein
MTAPRWQSATAAVWVAAASIVAAGATWLLLSPAEVGRWLSESGPVESLTAATYALCAVAVWRLRAPGDDWRSTLALSAVMAGFCMRELDWHKAFTGTTMLRLSWYWGPASPLAKAIAASVVLAFAAALVWLVWRHGRASWAGLRRREPACITLLVFALTLVLSKVLDRSVGILVDDFGLDVPLRWVALRSALEEWMELGLSILLPLGLLQRRAATIQACASPPTSSSRSALP